MKNLFNDLNNLKNQIINHIDQIKPTTLLEPSPGSVVFCHDDLGDVHASGIYAGYGDIITFENGQVTTVEAKEFSIFDGGKIYVACIDGFPAGFSSLLQNALSFLEDPSTNTASNSEEFVKLCIVPPHRRSQSGAHSLISAYKQYLGINSTGVWLAPYYAVSATGSPSEQEKQHISALIDEKETFNSATNMWERNKKNIQKTLGEHTGIISVIKSELAFINDDYAEYREKTLNENASAIDYMDDLFESINKDIDLLKARLNA